MIQDVAATVWQNSLATNQLLIECVCPWRNLQSVIHRNGKGSMPVG